MVKINKTLIIAICILVLFILLLEKDNIVNYLFYNTNNEVEKINESDKQEINKILIEEIDINKELIIENKEISYGEGNKNNLSKLSIGYGDNGLENTKIDNIDIETKKSDPSTVQFTRQAPFGDWSDKRQQNGCEEAASIMAVYWAQDKDLTLEIAKNEIIKISDFQLEKYGSFADTSSEDTVKRILNEYFDFYNAEVKYNITIEDIIKELDNGNLVLVPTNGQKLKNPYYTPPGATHHELVIKGYDKEMDEFITNDPGTKYGESYRYKTGILYEAIYDYKTGKDEKVDEIIKAMIIIKK